MNQKHLATISPQRHISHEDGRLIRVQWDEQSFEIRREAFADFVHALERGMLLPYAEIGDFSVVHVDDERREIWLGKACLQVSHAEYRTLLNAALRTETRLHGFKLNSETQTADAIELRPFVQFQRPQPIRLYWN
ncbi:MAG: hypothetical protein J0L63_20310 [Anaerolineae bacterium]|nr:hypothetical protein [Anaerolineae bacterium]MBN8621268.1 hypothetical protein [Anaerolineae bacterium]